MIICPLENLNTETWFEIFANTEKAKQISDQFYTYRIKMGVKNDSGKN